jgi:amino acid adenylation domain-containing protein
VDLLRLHAEKRPEKIAYRFLRDGEIEDRHLTYRELDAAARSVAALLEKHSRIGDRVLLLYPPGLDFIIALCGCFYAGRVAVPAYPPRPNRSYGRLLGIIQDASPTLALTTEEVQSRVLHRVIHEKAFQGLTVLRTDTVLEGSWNGWDGISIDPDALALLQYTSGSTATPKGVQITHANLIHNEKLIQRAFGQTEHDIILGWLPVYHDMGLIGTVLQPLYSGAESILMPPVAFLQNPVRWLAAISRYGATTSGGPNFAYELCCNKITQEQKANLDLSSWRVAFNGAEPVRVQSLERFANSFRDCGFRATAFAPCYGLAESTLFVSGGRTIDGPVFRGVQAVALEENRVVPAALEDRECRMLVACGKTFSEQKIAIVDPERLTRCKADAVGEIWVSGASVATGYWGREEETANTFQARIAETDEGPFLRTGDLGFVLDGQLFITGRRKDLIIIRGRNHYPQDLEKTAEHSHPLLHGFNGAAFSVESEGEERLVIIHEVNRRAGTESDAVIAAVRQAIVEEHELQIHAVILARPGEIPKTSSGKVQRFRCRQMFLEDTLKIVGEWRAASAGHTVAVEAESEAQIQDWQEWLIQQIATRLRLPSAAIDAAQPPSRYGLDSLVTVELAHEIEKTAGVLIPPSDLMSGLTIAEIAAFIAEQKRLAAASANAVVITHRHEAGAYPLSYGQRALFFLHQLDRNNSAYHIHQAVRIAQTIEVTALDAAFRLLAARHPALRTVFRMRDGNPVQEVLSPELAPVLEVTWSGDTEEKLIDRMAEEARRPFDLETVPAVRCLLFRKSETENYLLFVIHHIVSDFWSLSLFIHELAALYQVELTGEKAALPTSEVEYRDYVYWQADLLAGPEGERHWAHWRDELAGELPVLHLPTDYPRPAVQTFRGDAAQFRLDAGLARQLRTLAAANGATLYMVLVSGWLALLHRYSGQPEVITGSPAAGRTRSAFRSVAGYFVNPVVIRANFSGDPLFSIFLAQVRGKALSALAHQDFPFPLLVEKLQPQRDPSRSPLFQVLFVMQGELSGSSLGAFALNEPGAVFQTNGLSFESVSLGEEVSQFDVAVQVCEADEEIALRFNYNKDLFARETIARMAAHLRNLLEGAVNPELRISELPLLSAEERRTLESWNLTEIAYPDSRCLHQMIEAQVQRAPNAPAVWFEGRSLAYAELNRKANQIAHRLRLFGVGPESLVGVCMERSFALVASLLGILKAGAAYVPFDPSYPQERLNFLVEDADVPVLLMQESLDLKFNARQMVMVALNADCSSVGNESDTNPNVRVSPDNLAYVIYTSGSTGNPKGAMNSHRAISNRLQWMQAAYQLGPNDRILQKTPFSFDVSVWEFFWPLMTGASLTLARPEGHRDNAYLRGLIKEQRITTVHFVPSMLAMFLDEPGIEECVSLRRVIASGEALPGALVRRFFSRLNTELHNLYGPTEAAVDVTSFACARDENRPSIPIGTPIANIQTYVLDPHLELSPVGVVGELYIGGMGVGRGYHRRPELTGEKFLPDPFSSQPGARMYKTGDLVRYLSDRNIEFLGRNDHQVKVRGFRIELGEIEAALARHPLVSQAIVVARQVSLPARRPANYRVSRERQEPVSEFRGFLKPEAEMQRDRGGSSGVRLAAYIASAEGTIPGVPELRRFLRETLPDYMVPADFVFLSALPLSPNGKLDRQALPEPDTSIRVSAAEYAAPETATESLLAGIWSEVLGVPEIGVQDNFFELGGDSIRSLQVRARALKHGLTFAVQDMMRYQTIHELAQHVQVLDTRDNRKPLELFALVSEQDRRRMPEDVEDAYPLSKVQAGLIYHLQYDPHSAVYHDIFFYKVRTRLDFNLFRQAAQESVDRHPILRTSFHVSDFSEPLQVVHRHAAAQVECFDWRQLSATEQQKAIEEWTETEKHRPLHLQDSSLIRLFVHQLEDDVFQIVSSYYDILLDGWSEASLITGLLNRYSSLLRNSASPAPQAPVIRYRDFIALERTAMTSEETRAYWERMLNGCVVHPLQRWSGQTTADVTQVRSLDVALPTEVLQGLDALAYKAGAAPKHVFLVGHLKVMSLLAGHTDLVIGFQTHGRLEELDADQVLGMHNTTLPLRMKLTGGTWVELVRQAFETEHELMPHRRYPLVELQKIGGRQQLFETVFNHTHFHVFQSLASIPDIEILGAWGLERSHYTLRAEFNRNPFTGQIQFDLNCDVSQICTEQMQEIAACYSRVFRAMAEKPYSRYDADDLFSPAEIALLVHGPDGSSESATVRANKAQPATELTHVTGQVSQIQAILTPIEELVASMWCQILSKERLSPDANFFEAGGDSLLATQLMLYVRARLKIDLPLRILFEEASTLGTFARKVEETIRAGASLYRPPIERVSRAEAPPLSFAQRRLWFLEHLEPTVYNVPAAIRVSGQLDHAALERSLNAIVARHETLRTTFHLVEREPVQRIHESLHIEIPFVDLSLSSNREAEFEQFMRTETRRPFNLETGPLLRAYMVRLDEQDHVLLAILHHIISDGWSVGLFITEMVPLYEAFVAGRSSPLPELSVQYADFAAWQHGWLRGQILEQQIAYWRAKLSGPLPVQDIPADFSRPESMRGNGGLVATSLPEELVQQLRLLGNREGCTMFMTLLGAFYVLLHYYTRQQDLIVGTDLANRSSVETENMIGFFVNQMALQVDLAGDPAFTEILSRVRTVTLEGYLHQDVPFERVVEAVNPPRERNRTPLFQTKFVLQNAPRPKLEMAGLQLSEIELSSGIAKFDLLINVFQQNGNLRMLWEYSTEIFRETTIKRMVECFVTLLESVAANADQRLHESVAVLEQTGVRIRKSDDEKRHHTLREKLIQKSKKAISS